MNLKDQALVAIEGLVKDAINKQSDAVVADILLKIEEKVPGWLDSMIEAQKVAIEAAAKEALLNLADKISPNV